MSVSRYNENPFGLKSEDKYSNWSKNSSSWDTADRYDNKPSSTVEEISSSHQRDDDRSVTMVTSIMTGQYSDQYNDRSV